MAAVAPAKRGGAPGGTEHAGSDPLAQALHALAQLPDEVGLEVGCEAPQLRRLGLMASAYGVGGRIELRQSRLPGATWLRGAERIPHDARSSIAETVESLWPAHVESWLGGGDDRLLAGHRVALVTNLPTHYRIPLFSGLAHRLEAVGASLRVLFLGSSAGSRSWLTSHEPLDFDHTVLPGVSPPVRRRPPRLPLGIGSALRRQRPTIALSAGLSPAVSGRVQRYARASGIPFGLWSGEIPAHAARQPALRRLQRRRLAERADFAIAYGALAAQYLAAAAPELPVAIARNTSVLAPAETAPRAQGAPVRLITVGDLASPRKGVDVLLEALSAMPHEACSLRVVGDGRLREGLERTAAPDARVSFTGALPPSGVRAALADSDVFLFPSRSDVFGLALVEAMGQGLAVAASSAVGAVSDLAVSGRNSLVLGDHEPRSWADTIAGLVSDPELCASIGEAARLTIGRRWTIDHAIEGTLAGLRLGARIGAEGPAR
ncbi:MAG TPA: glycosyltransferase family 4 protein [Thermoleophilaceae bacterium]|nr:glycosyltransferase family 4 protein [Thermoleophilaceae bacterium]